MSDAVIVAMVSLVGTLAGTFGGITKANKLTMYRINQLEKKVEKHFSDVKMMYDWGCFTDDQVREFVPLCITEDEADKIISKEESAS